MKQFVVEYMSGVYKTGCKGWRQEKVTAVIAVQDGSKTGMITDVLSVGSGNTSKRQAFYEDGIKKREIGKGKRLACVNVVSEL